MPEGFQNTVATPSAVVKVDTNKSVDDLRKKIAFDEKKQIDGLSEPKDDVNNTTNLDDIEFFEDGNKGVEASANNDKDVDVDAVDKKSSDDTGDNVSTQKSTVENATEKNDGDEQSESIDDNNVKDGVNEQISEQKRYEQSCLFDDMHVEQTSSEQKKHLVNPVVNEVLDDYDKGKISEKTVPTKRIDISDFLYEQLNYFVYGTCDPDEEKTEEEKKVRNSEFIGAVLIWVMGLYNNKDFLKKQCSLKQVKAVKCVIERLGDKQYRDVSMSIDKVLNIFSRKTNALACHLDTIEMIVVLFLREYTNVNEESISARLRSNDYEHISLYKNSNYLDAMVCLEEKINDAKESLQVVRNRRKMKKYSEKK